MTRDVGNLDVGVVLRQVVINFQRIHEGAPRCLTAGVAEVCYLRLPSSALKQVCSQRDHKFVFSLANRETYRHTDTHTHTHTNSGDSSTPALQLLDSCTRKRAIEIRAHTFGHVESVRAQPASEP